MAINEPDRQNLLHGGDLGLHQQIFQPSPTRDSHRLVFSLALPHLSDGFPGDRLVTIRYELIDPTSLQCDFMAKHDRPTVMNLANHAYFNLGGPLEAHELRIFATGYTPANDRQIPTGAIAGLSETTDEGDDLDFRDWRALRDQALDHNFVLLEGAKLREAASLRLVESNLQLDVLSTQPAIQVYTGDGLAPPFAPGMVFVWKLRGSQTHPTNLRFQASFWSLARRIGSAPSTGLEKLKKRRKFIGTDSLSNQLARSMTQSFCRFAAVTDAQMS